jgi:hypothetical protein
MSKPTLADTRARLVALVEQAKYYLTDTDIEMLQPSPEGAGDGREIDLARSCAELEQLLYTPDVRRHPFSRARLDAFDGARMDLTLVRILKDPSYVAWTCYHLMCMTEGEPLRLAPFQAITLKELWWRQFPMMLFTRGGSKTTLLAIYILLRLTFTPGAKVAVVAKSLRQSMMVWETCSRIWHNSPLFRDLVGSGNGGYDNGPRRGGNDRCEFRINDSIALFLPLGATGDTIRGVRAQYVICDEFGSVSAEVYAVVVQGFGAVASDPTAKAADRNRERILDRLGLWNKDLAALEADSRRGNQSVISGTASFMHNHFYKFYRDYRNIISTGGDPKKLAEVMGGDPPPGFDWRHYSIIRLPFSKLPHGFMDEGTIARAKQISSTIAFTQEYECCFSTDSDGFFKRSLIELATCGGATAEPVAPPTFPSCGPVDFGVRLSGDAGKAYVFGVDPAFARDNFAVVVLEAWPDHRRVAYAWTTNKKDHRARRAGPSGASMDFYAFCVSKLRDMFARFPPAKVLIDTGAGGGGQTLIEAFSDPDKLGDGQRPVYPAIDPEEPRDTDRMAGDHLIVPFNFSKTSLVAEANWNLRKDLEDRVLLFPRTDEISFGLAYQQDAEAGRVVVDPTSGKVAAVDDTLENAMHEVEALKDELASIQHFPKGNVERWDVPDGGGRRGGGPLKKDRYSALLMANWAARGGTAGAAAVAPAVGGLASQLLRPHGAPPRAATVGGIPVAAYGRVVTRGRW